MLCDSQPNITWLISSYYYAQALFFGEFDYIFPMKFIIISYIVMVDVHYIMLSFIKRRRKRVKNVKGLDEKEEEW